jgi:hypothetical protein
MELAVFVALILTLIYLAVQLERSVRQGNRPSERKSRQVR